VTSIDPGVSGAEESLHTGLRLAQGNYPAVERPQVLSPWPLQLIATVLAAGLPPEAFGLEPQAAVPLLLRSVGQPETAAAEIRALRLVENGTATAATGPGAQEPIPNAPKVARRRRERDSQPAGTSPASSHVHAREPIGGQAGQVQRSGVSKSIGNLPRPPLAAGFDERGKIGRCDADRVADSGMRQFATLAQFVHQPGAEPEPGGHLLDGQQVVGATPERAKGRSTR
jgi:hypothetical protein